MPEFQQIATIEEISPGGRKSLIVDDVSVLLLRVGENFYCIEDVCSHDGQPLTDGSLEGTQIQCPRHGARFDITDGRALCMPAFEPITAYEVEIRDGGVFIKV